MVTPIAFEATQYRARPLGKVNEKKASIMGIIHSIMLLVDRCLSSVAGIIVIFCWTQVDTPTNTGSMGVGSGLARSSQRKPLLRGAMVSATGFQEYSLWERPTNPSGWVPSALRRAW